MDLDVAAQDSAGDDVDTILRNDPDGAYPAMDARSREDYQNRVRMWAQRSQRRADDVAQVAIALAAQASRTHGVGDRRAHVGYFLTDDGLIELAATLGAKLNWQERLRRYSSSRRLSAYYVAFFSLCAAYGLISVALFDFALPWFGQALLALVTALYFGPIVQNSLNTILPRVLRSRRMPRLDFSAGIPASAQTLVVVPCLLISRECVHKLGKALERLYLDNRSAGAAYALLSDFVDAPGEHANGDEALLHEACAQIAALNERHGGGFALLHRPRRWNAADAVWMGWERKRGKLEELNAWLMGGPSPFHTMHGDVDRLSGTRYVLTLDEDNDDLTPGAVHELAGALAHPLNRPVFGADGLRVEAGHILLQPRSTIVLSNDSAPSRLEMLVHSMIEVETAKRSLPAISSDQELFGQVPYVGKGIYDLAQFHRLMHGRVAENTTLNHDVLEGGTVRAGVVVDIVLHETFMPTFYGAVRRTHRWMRGDWQLLPWLLPTVRDASGARPRNPLLPFARWQIFYNAVRMIFPTASLLCFIIGWATCATPGLWTLYLLAFAWVPAIVALLLGTIRNLLAFRFKSTLRGLWAWLSLRSASFIFGVDQAHNTLDAALRSSVRMLITHRGMLEWTTASAVSARRAPNLAEYLRMMWTSPALAVAVVWLIDRLNPAALSSAVAFATLWVCAPFIAWWWSQKPREQGYSIQTSQP